MKVFKKNTDVGILYVNIKNNKMILRQNTILITDVDKIINIYKENRIPIKAVFELTGKCNLNCYFCYTKKLRKCNDLSTNEIYKIIDLLDDMGIIFLELIGGEPFFREDIKEILDYISTKNFIVSIFTNLMNVDSEIIELFKKLNLKQIRSSLLAPQEKLCDKLTGLNGSFKKIINNFKIIKEAELPLKVVVTITNENFKLIEEFKNLEKILNLKFLYAVDVLPTFDGYDDVKFFELDKKNIEFIRCIPNYKKIIKNTLKNHKCGVGKTCFSITPEGNILPCSKYRISMGNVIKEDFRTIWNKKKNLKIVDDAYKKDLKCEICNLKEYCAYCPGIYKECSQNFIYENNICKRAKIFKKILSDENY